MTLFQQFFQSVRRTTIRTIVGGAVVVGTVEATTHLPSQGRSSAVYHTMADTVATPLMRQFLNPEQAHHLALYVLSQWPHWAPTHRPSRLEQDRHVSQILWGGVHVPNPIALAAGFDKDAEAIQPLLDLGFGAVEIGSVCRQPQPGNPSPRMFRLIDDQAIVNRYGFNSQGMDAVQQKLQAFRLDQLEQVRSESETSAETSPTLGQLLLQSIIVPLLRRESRQGLVGVNLGKNKTSETPLEDYQALIQQLGPYADYLVVNVSSPNTPGLRDLQSTESLEYLLGGCLRARDELLTTLREQKNARASLPLLVKLSPDLTNYQLDEIAQVLLTVGVDGIIVTNTTTTRPNGLQSPNRKELGGLSGRPLATRSTECIRRLYAATQGQMVIFGVGGIFTAHDVYEKLKAGASLCQIYTGMVYQGPGLVSRLRDDLAQILKDNGHRRIEDVIGLDHEELYWERHRQREQIMSRGKEEEQKQEQSPSTKNAAWEPMILEIEPTNEQFGTVPSRHEEGNDDIDHLHSFPIAGEKEPSEVGTSTSTSASHATAEKDRDDNVLD